MPRKSQQIVQKKNHNRGKRTKLFGVATARIEEEYSIVHKYNKKYNQVWNFSFFAGTKCGIVSPKRKHSLN